MSFRSCSAISKVQCEHRLEVLWDFCDSLMKQSTSSSATSSNIDSKHAPVIVIEAETVSEIIESKASMMTDMEDANEASGYVITILLEAI